MKIIAEVGSNWKTLDDCLMSIGMAKKAGADAVKFQLFTKQDLYGPEASTVVMGTPPYLHPDWISDLSKFAKAQDIEFMCTAFSPEGYHLVDLFVTTHKIASAELTAIDILDKVNSFGKPVYLSTAGSNDDEIRTALEHLKDCAVTLMYCVADYPARIVDMHEILRMGPTFRCNVGYSDHTIDVLIYPQLAKGFRCSVLEKHVNFTEHTDTPDAPHSLNFDEFRLMCEAIKDLPLTKTVDELSNIDMRKYHKRRLINGGYYRTRK